MSKQNKSPRNVFSRLRDKILARNEKTPRKQTQARNNGKKLVVIGGYRQVWVCNHCKGIVKHNQIFCDECGANIEKEV